MLLHSYYYGQHYDEETSREYAYTAIRNLLAALILWSSIIILSAMTCVFGLKIRLLDGPIFFVTTGVLLCIYLLFTKKFFKPIFNNIELEKEKTPKKYFFVITVVSAGLFSGGMYILGRGITICLCG